MSWPKVKLGEVLENADLFTDGDWVESKDQDPNGEVRLIQLADIGDGVYINKSSRFLNNETFQKLKCTEIIKGDILLARMPDPLGRCCIFEGDEKKCITVVDVCVIRVNSKTICKRWLMHAINSEATRKQILSYARGATRVRISRKDLSRLLFSVPPLEEQKRIAGILDKANEIKAKRELALAKLDELAQSTFIEMFGDPLLNLNRHNIFNLGEITQKITDGEHLNPNFIEKGMPIVMAGNVLEEKIELETTRHVSIDDGSKFRKKCNPNYGDLLMVSRGATIGRVTVVDVETDFCLMGSVILIKLDASKVHSLYLSALLKFQNMRSNLYKTSGSSAQQAIYLKDLKNLKCMLPDIANQIIFAEKIKTIKKSKAELEKSLINLVVLNKSLQHQAFTTGFNS